MQNVNDMTCKWLFVDEHSNATLISVVCDWQTAIIEYVSSLFVGAKRNLFVQAFSGFESIESAIEFFNTIYQYSGDKIVAMVPLTECAYVNEQEFDSNRRDFRYMDDIDDEDDYER